MTTPQTLVLCIIAAVFALFLVGRWRYDVVAFSGLLVAVLVGVVPAEAAFDGFGHPATIAVAAVLIISRALRNAGVTDFIAARLEPATGRTSIHVAALAGIGGILSSFMNNVGALALLMPVAVRSALKAGRSPAAVLMPLSFASMLGGLITLIGTPPNIIIAAYREQVAGAPFRMFDFSPVGATVALAGIAFLALYGWRLIPSQRRAATTVHDLIAIDDYIAEVRVPKSSALVGRTWREADELIGKHEVVVVSRVRRGKRLPGVPAREPVKASDILIVEAGPEELDKFVTALGLKVVGTEGPKSGLLRADDIGLMEAVVAPGAGVEGRMVRNLRLRRRHGVNLLGVSRQGKAHRGRLRTFRFRVGDVLLLHGENDRLADAVSAMGCLPLSERSLRFGTNRSAAVALAVFAAAIAAAAVGLIALPIALGLAAVAMVLLAVVSLREIYDSVDWPVIVLLASMIPIGGALESTGTAELLVGFLLGPGAAIAPSLALALVLIVTMALSAVLNNAATAIIMAPIGVIVARHLGANPDAFLMAVAVGASCAFLTPIGHQNNALVMGPGGYEFGDYWRLGLPLEVLVVAVAVPMITLVWPL